MNIMQQPYFLQAAGSANKQLESGIYLRFSDDNALLLGIKFEGTRKIRSTYKGQPVEQTYTDLNESAMHIQADAGTDIVITGGGIDNLACGTSLSYIYNSRSTLMTLDVSGCTELDTLDFSGSFAPNQIYANGCTSLESIISIDEFTYIISFRGCTSLVDCDLSDAALTYADLSGCTMLGSDVLDNMGNAILNYLDVSGLYFTVLDLTKFGELRTLKAANMPYLTDILELGSSALEVVDVSNDVKLALIETPSTLTTLNCAGCMALGSLRMEESISLTMLNCTGIPNIKDIRLTANNESVANSVANAISTSINTNDGTVTLGANDTYVSIIKTAANAKEWNVSFSNAS